MTEKTLTPKFRVSKKKTGEISRLVQFMESSGLHPVDISKETDVSERTIKNCIYDDLPLGGKLLRILNLKYGVSIDWLLTGNGSMLMTEKTVPAPDFCADDERLARIVTGLQEWITCATDAEYTWLEYEVLQTLKTNWPPLGMRS